MSLFDVLNEPLTQRVALALLHFVWQGFVIAGLVAVVLRCGRVRQPRFRYTVQLVAFGLLAAVPVVTVLVIDAPLATFDERRAFVASPSQPPLTAIAPAETASALEWPASIPASRTTGTLPPADHGISPRVLAWIVGLWGIGVLLLCGRLLFGWIAVRRLKHASRPLPADMARTLAPVWQRLGCELTMPVRVSDGVIDALALGFWRPMILLPSAWLLELRPDVLEAIVAHELAHIRRHDLWVNLFQRVVETLLFYHPAVWWLSGHIRAERELCCDELAIAATGRRVAYAEALEQVAHLQVAARRPLFSTALGGEAMTLLERVRHVLGTGRLERRTGWWPAGLLALTIPIGLWAAATPVPRAVADDGRDKAAGTEVEVAQREDEEREQPREERREVRRAEERERPAVEREREHERKGDAPREGERREEEHRERDRERVGEDRDRPDGDRPFRVRIHRDGRAIEGEFGRHGAEMRFGGDRPLPPGNAELMRVIGELRREVEMLRREVRELRGNRGELPPGPPPRRDGDRREGFDPPGPPRDRDFERRPEGERRPEAERPDGDRPGPREGEPRRPGPRDGERREFRGPRDGEREVPRERRDGDREAPAERPERQSREE